MNGYDILGRLGSGAMGEVLLARDRSSLRLVAVKRLLVRDDEDHARRLLDEARACAAIGHPNVIRVVEVGYDDEGPFLVLEYVHGDTLLLLMQAARNRGHFLAVEACVRVAHDVALGLHAAHQRGIVHRDVKPSNVMLGLDGRVRILDFGIALPLVSSSLERLANPTRVGSIRGTVPYMSPEQVSIGPGGEKLEVGPASDQFSLGVLLWEAISGRSLFRANHDVATAARIVECHVPPLASVRDRVPEALDEVVLRMLERRARDRFASCAEAAAALNRAVPVGGAHMAVAAALAAHAGDEIRRRHTALVKGESARPRSQSGTQSSAPSSTQSSAMRIVPAEVSMPGRAAAAVSLVPDVAARDDVIVTAPTRIDRPKALAEAAAPECLAEVTKPGRRVRHRDKPTMPVPLESADVDVEGCDVDFPDAISLSIEFTARTLKSAPPAFDELDVSTKPTQLHDVSQSLRRVTESASSSSAASASTPAESAATSGSQAWRRARRSRGRAVALGIALFIGFAFFVDDALLARGRHLGDEVTATSLQSRAAAFVDDVRQSGRELHARWQWATRDP